MLQSIFATKIGMTQAWDSQGHRLAVTKCKVTPNVVVEARDLKTTQDSQNKMYIIGFGKKKLKNMTKPLKIKLEKSGFSFGVTQMQGVVATDEAELTPGTLIDIEKVLKIGDVVEVQGVTKGRGFAGGVKRYGFHGGPRTHGQSDRERAVGSIGSGTTPGRVYKGKRMPGHYGTDAQTVKGLVVLHIDQQLNEVWLSGPIPGFSTSTVRISPTGNTKKIELDLKASRIEATQTKVPVEHLDGQEKESDIEENKE